MTGLESGESRRSAANAEPTNLLERVSDLWLFTTAKSLLEQALAEKDENKKAGLIHSVNVIVSMLQERGTAAARQFVAQLQGFFFSIKDRLLNSPND